MYRTSKSVMFKDFNSYIRVDTNAHYIMDYINNHSNLKK